MMGEKDSGGIVYVNAEQKKLFFREAFFLEEVRRVDVERKAKFLPTKKSN